MSICFNSELRYFSFLFVKVTYYFFDSMHGIDYGHVDMFSFLFIDCLCASSPSILRSSMYVS